MDARLIEATRAAQGLMKAFKSDLVVDGHWGTFTQGVFNGLSSSVRQAVTAMLSTYSTSPELLRNAYLQDKAAGGADKQRAVKEREDAGILSKIAGYFSGGSASQTGIFKAPIKVEGRVVDLTGKSYTEEELKRAARGVSSPAGVVIFVTKTVPLLMKRAKELGFQRPEILAAQFAKESGWGTHMAGNFNYGGFKASKDQKSTQAPSPEGFGAAKNIQISSWVIYDSPEDFVERALAKLKRTWPDTFTATTQQEFLKAWRMYDGGTSKYSTAQPDEYVSSIKDIVAKYYSA
jgi:hypothetical protein